MIGVTYEKSRSKWAARYTENGKRVTLGRFDSQDEAELALGLYQGRIEAARIDDKFDREFTKFSESSMRLEETKSKSVFTRLKGFRLKRHKL